MAYESTLNIGYAGESFAEGDLTLKGFNVSRPTSNGITYDLIAESGGIFYRVQVKAVTPKDGKLIVFPKRNNKRTGDRRYYSESDYDVLSVVDIHSRRVAYLRNEDVTKSQVSLILKDVDTSTGYTKKHPPKFFNDYVCFPINKDAI